MTEPTRPPSPGGGRAVVQINDPNEPERLEDIERILPPRDRWPDQRLKRDAARKFHLGFALLIYFSLGFALFALAMALALLSWFLPIDLVRQLGTPVTLLLIGLYPITLISFTVYAYMKLGWKRFPLTMLMIPAPIVVLVVLETIL